MSSSHSSCLSPFQQASGLGALLNMMAKCISRIIKQLQRTAPSSKMPHYLCNIHHGSTNSNMDKRNQLPVLIEALVILSMFHTASWLLPIMKSKYWWIVKRGSPSLNTSVWADSPRCHTERAENNWICDDKSLCGRQEFLLARGQTTSKNGLVC